MAQGVTSATTVLLMHVVMTLLGRCVTCRYFDRTATIYYFNMWSSDIEELDVARAAMRDSAVLSGLSEPSVTTSASTAKNRHTY